MQYKMNEKMIEAATDAIESCDNYFNEFSKENGKKGYVWVENEETRQLFVYTRGEYTEQILKFLETLK